MGGGSDASSARYIYAKLNRKVTSLVFPDIDYCILPFNFDEGQRGEPKYFVPIIPTVICESAELPAHGWKLKLWARNIFKVIENVRRLIRIDDAASLLKMPPAKYEGSPYEWKGEIKTIRGDPFSFGRYSLDETNNKLVITELPLRVWTNPYVNALKKKVNRDDNKIIESVHDDSDDIGVKIDIKLKPGALALLRELGDSYFADGIEEYFQLRDRMDSHINLYGMDSEVIMFDSYESVMYHWFPVRREYYGKRIVRLRTLYELEIKMYENIIKYVDNSIKMNMPKRKEAEMIELLASEGYDKIFRARINNPGFMPTEDLEHAVLYGPDANFNYLLDLSDRKKSEESLQDY
jgi:DNA topoisomerase-2